MTNSQIHAAPTELIGCDAGSTNMASLRDLTKRRDRDIAPYLKRVRRRLCRPEVSDTAG
jgi:hypothetical protein